ncbi:MAG TPA: lamin tail domain-containing protein [Thermoanaerobaculia bacterium]|jgi:hypothetical protein|nr:lamin tail domain-containing protein [Thermoanaerobaculia bacterium]
MRKYVTFGGPLNLLDPRPLFRRRALQLLLAAALGLSLPGRATAAGDVLISEFRFRGPNGPGDEFIELYNNTGSSLLINSVDGSAGWALVAFDGVTRFVVPNNTVLPPRAHYLATNLGYSLDGYGGSATGDISYFTDIPDGAGIALFRTADPANFNLTTRVDAVGYSAAPALYREGNGLPGQDLFNLEYSFYRNLASGPPQDSDDNLADFLGVDTNGSVLSTGQRLGAPGPENLSSPVQRNGELTLALLDPGACQACAPNRERDSSPQGTFGTLIIRRTLINTTGRFINRVRFRVVNITTFPAPSGVADLRAVTSSDSLVTLTNGTTVTVKGTILEEPPFQDFGGGWNSSLTFSPQGLAPGASVNLQFVLGVEQTGSFRFFVNIEAD